MKFYTVCLIVFSIVISVYSYHLNSPRIIEDDQILPREILIDVPNEVDFNDTNKDHRIVNGQAANVGQFPYQVGLSLRFSTTIATSWCGGSLISHTWVLTAAHCTRG